MTFPTRLDTALALFMTAIALVALPFDINGAACAASFALLFGVSSLIFRDRNKVRDELQPSKR